MIPRTSLDIIRAREKRIRGGIRSVGNSKNVGSSDSWQPKIVQPPDRKSLRTSSIAEPQEYPRRPTEEQIEDKNTYQIIVEIPHHKESEVNVELQGDILSVETTKYKWYKEFFLPANVLAEDYEQKFQNGILSIAFKKEINKKGQVKSKQLLNCLSFFRISNLYYIL